MKTWFVQAAEAAADALSVGDGDRAEAVIVEGVLRHELERPAGLEDRRESFSFVT